MERNALLAVAISIAILLVYYEVLLPRLYPAPPKSSPPLGAPAERAERDPARDPEIPELEPLPELAPAAIEAAAPAIAALADAPEVTIETDLYTAVFTAAGGRLRSLTLKAYSTSNAPGSPPLEMVVPGSGGRLPMGLELRGEQMVSDDGVLYEIRGDSRRLSGEEEASLSLFWRASGITVEKRLRFRGDSYPFFLDVVPQEVPAGTVEIGLSWLKGISADDESGGLAGVFQGVVAVVDGKLVHKAFSDLDKGEVLTGDVGWAAYGSTYFISAVIPENGENTRLWMRVQNQTAETRVLSRTSGSTPVSFELYVGPKETEALEGAGHGLQKAVDYGYFAFIAVPMLQVLRFLHYVTGNWGVAIVLLTLGIKILFIPLTQKSFKSMREMQKLQPQMQKLREKLKDTPEQMNKEIMELYRRHKVNPLSGCLPMVLQIPVFIGLYNALLNAIELRHAPFMLWINDLSVPDRLGSLPIPFVEPPGIPVLTVIMGASMLVQQWMTPAMGDPMQQRMMMIMPLIFTVMFVNFPAGLVLYWLVNNVLTIAQQYVMMRKNK